MQTPTFDYENAFSRNIGWFTESEQAELKDKCVAIAGCGGVGGIHTLTMARLGIGRFKLADFDDFGIENFNRQVGATMDTVGLPKLDVTQKSVKGINPDAYCEVYPKGINDENIDVFLDGADLYIDSLDFFAMPPRRLVFQACADKGIPAVTAAPLGMGTAFLCFLPGKMTFEEYFGMEGRSELEQFLRFYIGLAPNALHANYLVDPTRLDLAAKKGPSTITGCTMCAGVASAYAAKILLNRGPLIHAPEGVHWDPYVEQRTVSCLEGGHLNPDFQKKLAELKPVFGIE
ncbi:ThiF family adenylyltransferase [Bowmanella denitrificans]